MYFRDKKHTFIKHVNIIIVICLFLNYVRSDSGLTVFGCILVFYLELLPIRPPIPPSYWVTHTLTYWVQY